MMARCALRNSTVPVRLLQQPGRKLTNLEHGVRIRLPKMDVIGASPLLWITSAAPAFHPEWFCLFFNRPKRGGVLKPLPLAHSRQRVGRVFGAIAVLNDPCCCPVMWSKPERSTATAFKIPARDPHRTQQQ